MEANEKLQEQEEDLIFALDIGTRSVIGVLGKTDGDRLKVLAIDAEEHSRRAMMDGQIEDIGQVARIARIVTDRLEKKIGRKLTRVCVAAAGRALRMERASYQISLAAVRQIDDELISRLEAGAVSAAEEQLGGGENEDRRFYLVGYSVVRYMLDHYPLTTLKSHNGRELEAEVVATFLPSEVVESLYAAMSITGLEVVNLTLEPIAALNAAIPAELRLLNLVLADIGAGTSDIAVCREGSVVGYTMATVAGDEITEALMKAYLTDFKTAERLKTEIASDGPIIFRDVLGCEQSVPVKEVRAAIQDAANRLADEISRRVLEVNGGSPSALFLAGGGSKLDGLLPLMASRLGVDERRVAVAGNNFGISAYSDDHDLENPEYTTPLGIAISAGLGLVSDSYRVLLNGKDAKLFRSGALSVLDILMMNGYTYADLIGRTGRSLAVTVNGERTVLRGGQAEPSVLLLNGQEIPPSTVVRAGDSIDFTPAKHGKPAPRTVGELLGDGFEGLVTVNGKEAPPEFVLHTGDVIRIATDESEAPPEDELEIAHSDVQPLPVEDAEALVDESAPVEVHHTPPVAPMQPPVEVRHTPPVAPMQPPVEVRHTPPVAPMQPPVEVRHTPPIEVRHTPLVEPTPSEKAPRGPITIRLNGDPVELLPKADGNVHYLMDLLPACGIDFDNLDRPVILTINDEPGMFLQELKPEDEVLIYCEEAQ